MIIKYKKEKDLQSAVKKAIQECYGDRVYYIHPRSTTQKDLLDTYLCFFGRFVVIECKRDLNIKGPTKIQQYHLNKIKNAGGIVIVADNVIDVMISLNKIIPSFS